MNAFNTAATLHYTVKTEIYFGFYGNSHFACFTREWYNFCRKFSPTRR